MIVLKSEQIIKVESECGAQSFMNVIGDCYSYRSNVDGYVNKIYICKGVWK